MQDLEPLYLPPAPTPEEIEIMAILQDKNL
jgi:hypothetical protein